MTGNELLIILEFIKAEHPELMNKQLFTKVSVKNQKEFFKMISPPALGNVKIQYKSSQYGIQNITPEAVSELAKSKGFNPSSIKITTDMTAKIAMEDANVLFL